MLDIQRIRDIADQVRQAVLNKKSPVDIDAVLNLDNKRRDTIQEVERLKNIRNTRSMEIAALKKEKKDASALIDEMKSVSERIKALDTELGSIESEIREYLIRIPNIPHSSVPHGESEKDNVVDSEWGEAPQFDFKPRDHLELGTALDIIDFPRGAKIAGAGFPVLKGAGALLEHPHPEKRVSGDFSPFPGKQGKPFRYWSVTKE
jgi:seryl-tRNA synthetase